MKFIFDENLSPGLAKGLNEFGEDTEHITDHLQPGATDELMLKLVGENGWFLITRDKKIRRRPIEKEALKKHKVGAFFLGGKQMNSWHFVCQVVRIWIKLKDRARTTDKPFAYFIDRHGTKIESLPLD